ncbi:hypothetical protein Nepgr_013214 [Nepenthes gracilis]|uniref:MADS-box domain-containing protein n=1 Tax=Nepenthes gracilis TaxID=150966 RepID=A0AAD3SHF9_NEPGR|nr:hypothetical protein Nepgr_013214 [Nepenthes gracilis]
MTRKKVNLAYITNDSARKTCFRKRKKGLLKKTREISILCGVDACAIVFSQYDVKPEVWPSPVRAERTVAKFKGLAEEEQTKRMMNHEELLRKMIMKADEQLRRRRRENREMEMTQVMFQCLRTTGGGGMSFQSLCMADLSELAFLIDRKLKVICKRVESLKTDARYPAMIAGGLPLLTPPPQPVPPRGSAAPNQVGAEWSGAEQSFAGLRSFNVGMDPHLSVQMQPWIIDQMMMNNPPNQTAVIGQLGRGNVMLPLADPNNDFNVNPMWSNSFFP